MADFIVVDVLEERREKILFQDLELLGVSGESRLEFCKCNNSDVGIIVQMKCVRSPLVALSKNHWWTACLTSCGQAAMN